MTSGSDVDDRTALRAESARDVSMHDVAASAGVSVATVSRVLSGVGTVRTEYRERVMATVARLGYRTNRLARNLRRKQADMIGVVVTDIENPHFSEMVREVERLAYEQGYRVLLCITDESPQKQGAYLDILAGERAVGVIMAPSQADAPEIGRLLDHSIPIVAWDRHVTDPRADSVVADNATGTRIATEHLLSLGHRAIGFISGRTDLEIGGERLEGYRNAMVNAGLTPLVTYGNLRIEGGRSATMELLESPQPPTALIVANNMMSVGALHALREHNISVPEQMAMVAVDDPFWAGLLDPPLTVLAQPVRQMAATAMTLLLERIEGRRVHAKSMRFMFEMRIRQSCGSIR
jgi:LacI family transcriptional regulator